MRPGDVVSWQLPHGIETIILTLALARLGVVQNPLVMMLRERELGFICRQARSRWLRVLLIDGPLPSGDPGTLPAPPDDGTAVRWIFYKLRVRGPQLMAGYVDAALDASAFDDPDTSGPVISACGTPAGTSP